MTPHPFRRWRISAGLTQQEMARLIGCTQARISKFECGQIRRLQPEQADRAYLVSRGEVSREDCLFATPFYQWHPREAPQVIHVAQSSRRKAGRRTQQPP